MTSLRALVRHVPFVGGGHEHLSRSVVKTACYRVFMIVISITVAYVFTGSVGSALGIGLTTNVVKTGTYFGYERLWNRIDWGYEASDGSGRLAALKDEAVRGEHSDRVGAVVTFTGRVRTHDDGDDARTTHLAFERHDALAREQLAAIADDLTDRDGVHEVLFHHEDGRVDAGEDVVHVVAVGAHREEAFDAARRGIDRLKDEVPIFKKEVTVDDAYWAHERDGGSVGGDDAVGGTAAAGDGSDTGPDDDRRRDSPVTVAASDVGEVGDD